MTTMPFTNEQVETLIVGIVQSIPGATVRRNDDGLITGFQMEGEVGVRLAYDRREHRVNVSGDWPMSKLAENNRNYGTVVTPRELYGAAISYSPISISADKNPVKIAAEIGRRFMPGYLETLKRCIEVRDRNDAYVVNQRAFALEVAELLGGRGSRADGTMFSLPGALTDGECYGSVEVAGEKARFQIYALDRERSKKLIEFLKTL